MESDVKRVVLGCVVLVWSLGRAICWGDVQLESRLQSMAVSEIEAHVRLRGDARRGAVLFHTSAAACVKCHTSGEQATPLGPDLTKLDRKTTVAEIAESLLQPSKTIRKGYETRSVVTRSGRIHTGLLADETEQNLILRDAKNLLTEVTIPRGEIEEVQISKTSMMPRGLVASLRDESEFFDLVRYIQELATGGSERAAQLRPHPDSLHLEDDTQDLAHATILRSLDEQDLQAGRRIYFGHCVNCHGEDGNTPRLPTARAFGTEPLKFGADPYRMFQTLSRGAGLMAPMRHLSPRERYQVVYFVREELMRDNNPEYELIDDAYLTGLPAGTQLGETEQQGDRDYGPVLGSQLGSQVNNGLTFRLRNDVAVCYDLHRMRLAAAWQGGFLNLSETHHYKQRGERMPQIDGDVLPGLGHWEWELGGSFVIPEEAKPPRGPVRRDWCDYRGHSLFGDRAILSYVVHNRPILETIDSRDDEGLVSLMHTLHVGPGSHSLRISVAQLASTGGPAGLVKSDLQEILPFDSSRPHATAILTGQPHARNVPQPHPNRPQHVVSGARANELDLGTPGRTILVRFRTQDSGTLLASAPAAGLWKPNGKTLFVRGGRLVYDIGWVGAMTSRSQVADGQWHVAALVVDDSQTQLFVDGQLEAEREEFRRAPVKSFVLKVGATATNFGGDFDGDIDWIQILDRSLTPQQIEDVSRTRQPPQTDTLFAWTSADTPGSGPTVEPDAADSQTWGMISAAHLSGAVDGLRWSTNDQGRLILTIPASQHPRQFTLVRTTMKQSEQWESFHKVVQEVQDRMLPPLESLLHGGELRWPEVLELTGRMGESVNGYALDTIQVPFENPWNAWLRTSALDFFDDGRCVVTTHGGDVYIVSGIDDSLHSVRWKRFAAGLFEPFGVRVVDNQIYVTCRDGLKRLHDVNGDGEADFVEAFWNDDDVSSSFHAYNFDLQTDSQGNFYFAKAGQYTQHHRPGTIMRIPPAGGSAEVVAWGLRTPNGMGILPDDRLTVSDNQGPWMPAGKVSLVRPGSFLGNMPINEEQTQWLKQRHGGQLPDSFDEPIVWTPQELDNSCGGQVWAGDERFGPLSGRLIHSSFGKGWLYSMSLQEVGDDMQGAIFALPHQWQAGVMRLRMNPVDGQLYGVGLSGWQGPADGLDGGLQRLRYTGAQSQLIDDVQIVPEGIELRFTFAVDPQSASQPKAYSAEMWNYLWSRRYGSEQFSVRHPERPGHDDVAVTRVDVLSPTTVRLVMPDLEVCDQLQLKMHFNDAQQRPYAEQVFLTIHAIPEQ